MRSFLILIYFILFFLLTLPFLLLAYIIGVFSKKAQYKYTYYVGKGWSNILLFLAGTKITVTGLHNIPDGPALFVGNHRSLFDIPALYRFFPNPTGFVSKNEMSKLPIMSWWMSSIGCIFLNRDDVRAAMKTMLLGIDLLKQGQSLVIFPEGTRSKTEDMLPFKQGSLKFAQKANVPIVPFGISNTDQILKKNSLNVKSANITLNFGEPIDLNTLSKEELKKSAEYVQDIVKSLI
ncbi:1-acyl-sn-glycerol-3-phosphate acyltransferase [Natranaerovirga hydrolytica]|uniref:1-acyl-sn-glycerol-3-phosphate acyltransferase n=1 Tax=Natranaerovirga hydrolytica TaxID=680378 RepID=A0A4R1MN52_9FIRM|nr:lysophospholipid acyltransferase family protein [Natranaerovirga hydrolytica]TCK93352.1 1-acyl-sn-glycerol-3-phosphate acyltransferase [Natranaerovirga hydrolytica]